MFPIISGFYHFASPILAEMNAMADRKDHDNNNSNALSQLDVEPCRCSLEVSKALLQKLPSLDLEMIIGGSLQNMTAGSRVITIIPFCI